MALSPIEPELPGLNTNESLVYRQLLLQGPAPIASLLKTLPLQRSNVYAVLKSLSVKGLVREERGKTTTFIPSSPENLEELSENQILAAQRRRHELNQILPTLISQYRDSSYRPLIKSREGLKGIISLYEEILADGQHIDSIEDGGQMATYLGKYAEVVFPSKRLKLGVFNRVLAPSTNSINPSDPTSLRETRFIDPAVLPFRMDVKITAHMVLLVTFQRDSAVGILINNDEITANFQLLFNFLWASTSSE